MSSDPKDEVLRLVQQRNQSVSTFVISLILQSGYVLQNEKFLEQKINRKIAERKQTIVLTTSVDGQLYQQQVLELQSKIMTLQEEMKSFLKENTENSKELRLITTKLREHQDSLREKDLEIEELRKKKEDLEDLCSSSQEEIKSREITIAVLRNELKALQELYLKNQEKIKQLEQENFQLIERWKILKAEEAERMNRENESHYKTLKQKQQNSFQQKVDKAVDKLTELSSFSTAGRPRVDFTVPKRLFKEFVAHKEEVTAAKYNLLGSYLATVSADKHLKLWEPRSGTMKAGLSGATGSLLGLDISLSSLFVVAGAADNCGYVWGVEDGRLKHTLTGHSSKVYGVSFTGDGQKIVTGSHDRTLKLFDISNGYCLKSLSCSSSCNDVTVSTDSNLIVSGHLDAHVRLFDTKNGDLIHEFEDIHTKQVTSVSISDDGMYLLTSSRDNTLRLLDIRRFDTLHKFSHLEYSSTNFSRACFSPEGLYVSAGGCNGTVFIWNAMTEKLETTLNVGSKVQLGCVTWDPQGRQLVCCDKNGKCYLWY